MKFGPSTALMRPTKWRPDRHVSKGLKSLMLRNLLTRMPHANLGRTTSRVDQAGTWGWTYDGESGRVLSETLASVSSVSSVVSYSYHPETFDLASVSVGDAYRVEYTWLSGRLTALHAIAGSVTNDFSYSYTPDLNLVSGVSNSVFQTSKFYDLLGRLTNISSSVFSVPDPW